MDLQNFALLILYPLLAVALVIGLLISVTRSSKPISIHLSGLGVAIKIERLATKGLAPHVTEHNLKD
jgi:hypothetical protein